MFTLTETATFEQDIKKSRFLAICGPISSEEDAKRFFADHSDITANHNCWAWRIGQAYRFSDDGEPSGYVHLKDVLDLDDDEYTEPVPPKRIRTLISIYRDMDLEDALATLRRAGSHVARVFDESGDTRGVLFLEDIIEELVGEVQDATRRS